MCRISGSKRKGPRFLRPFLFGGDFFVLKKLVSDERGSSFLENALWIILFVLTIAAFTANLADATGQKFEELRNRITQIGAP
jgi:hypothetical protein